MSNIEADQLRIAFSTERRAWTAREAELRDQIADLRDLLQDCLNVLDNYVDVVDACDGTPRANDALDLTARIEAVL